MDFDFTLPGLGRPESSRPKRVAEAIRNELTLQLRYAAADPRLAKVAISRVTVAADLKLAKIHFTLPSGQDPAPALAGMRRAKGFFRSHLAKTLNLRHTPDLLFFFDTLNEEADRIEALFRQLEEERRNERS